MHKKTRRGGRGRGGRRVKKALVFKEKRIVLRKRYKSGKEKDDKLMKKFAKVEETPTIKQYTNADPKQLIDLDIVSSWKVTKFFFSFYSKGNNSEAKKRNWDEKSLIVAAPEKYDRIKSSQNNQILIKKCLDTPYLNVCYVWLHIVSIDGNNMKAYIKRGTRYGKSLSWLGSGKKFP